jgi:membrane protein YdbS with pleckstrin-like domain
MSAADEEPATEEAVAAHTTDERTVSPRVQAHWGLRLLAGLAVLTVIGATGASRFNFDSRIVLALAGVLAVLGLGWVHLRYRVWCYHVREDALYLERGVVTHVRTVAPHVRIQHVDTSRSPLERALGLSTLVVYTAGSRGADVSVPGLTPEEELAIETEGGDAL